MFESAASKLRNGIYKLVQREPFFGYLMYGLDLIEKKAEDNNGVSLATNGKALVYDPEWLKSLPPHELEAVLAHEALHIALVHPARHQWLVESEGEVNELIYQVSCDCVVNYILKKHNYRLPSDAVPPEMFQYQPHETAEDVYHRLKQQADENGGGPKPEDQPSWGMAGGAGSGDEEGDGEGEGQGSQQQEAGLQKKILEAASKARERGTLPGDLESIINAPFESTRDWRDSLRRYLMGGEEHIPTWNRPNRRYVSEDIYLPGATKYGPKKICVMIDSSGSIDESLAAKFIGELTKIQHDLMPEKIYVVVCDAQVQWTGEFSPYEDIEVKLLGRGGTDFRPAFQWIIDQGIDVAAKIYFTDCFGQWPERPVPDTLVVVWPGGGESPSWAERIDID